MPSPATGETNSAFQCPSCDQTGPYGAFGWCSACYQRWKRAGRPETGPPPPMTREEYRELALAACRANAESRRQDYQELRSWGESQQQAAVRVGVSERTVHRYERTLRQEVAA